MITSDGAKRKLVIKKVTLDDQSDISCMAMNVKTTTKLKIEGKGKGIMVSLSLELKPWISLVANCKHREALFYLFFFKFKFMSCQYN